MDGTIEEIYVSDEETSDSSSVSAGSGVQLSNMSYTKGTGIQALNMSYTKSYGVQASTQMNPLFVSLMCPIQMKQQKYFLMIQEVWKKHLLSQRSRLFI